MGLQETDPLSQLVLPPGFRFYPTDEELLVQYLCRKVAGQQFSLQIIGDIDLYKFDPWDLPSKAIFGEKEWYFFSPRDRKYPNGSRPNRVAGSGYWKATGTDKIITTQGRKVGIKKSLVFYIGKAPKGTKTNWIMHEYRLSESSRKPGTARLDDWVLCRIYKKNSTGQKPAISGVQSSSREYSHGSSSSCSSQYDDVLESLPAIDDSFLPLPQMNSMKNFQQLGSSGNFDWASLAGLSSLSDYVQAQQPGPTQNPQMNIANGENDMFVPPLPQIGRSFAEDEVQSRIPTQRISDNSRSFTQNPSTFTRSFSKGLDPFRVRYPTNSSGFGFSDTIEEQKTRHNVGHAQATNFMAAGVQRFNFEGILSNLISIHDNNAIVKENLRSMRQSLLEIKELTAECVKEHKDLAVASFKDSEHNIIVTAEVEDTSGSAENNTSAAFHSDGLILGTGTSGASINIWDKKSQVNVMRFVGHVGAVTAISFFRKWLFPGELAQNGVKLWDLLTLRHFRIFSHYEQNTLMMSMEFDHSGSYLAIIGSYIRVYQDATLKSAWNCITTFSDLSSTDLSEWETRPDQQVEIIKKLSEAKLQQRNKELINRYSGRKALKPYTLLVFFELHLEDKASLNGMGNDTIESRLSCTLSPVVH